MLVFAGDPLSAEERQLARDCGVSSGIVEVVKPSDAQLRLLYNDAAALVFPSLHEGFGWPLLEAQACGCPVICSDREPMPEVTGDAALFCAADDAAAFAARVLELEHDAALRGDLVRRGLANAAGHSRSAMIGRLEALFERAIAQR
jgi:glycosyltransferase involved in cell wall biosynthesis